LHAIRSTDSAKTATYRRSATTTKSKLKSDAFKAIDASGNALHDVGTVGKTTSREFDDTCLTTADEIAPLQIKKILKSNHVSQPILRATTTLANQRYKNGRSVRIARAPKQRGASLASGDEEA
jgi:putative transcriptional regulator